MPIRSLVLVLVPLTALAAPSGATPEDARAFVKKVNEELKTYSVKDSTAGWIKATFITEDTERASAWASDNTLAYKRQAIQDSSASTGFPSIPRPPG